MARSTGDYVRVAAAGGGLIINAATKSAGDLVRIATAAAASGAKITLTATSTKSTGDLVRIAAAGGGAVVFED